MQLECGSSKVKDSKCVSSSMRFFVSVLFIYSIIVTVLVVGWTMNSWSDHSLGRFLGRGNQTLETASGQKLTSYDVVGIGIELRSRYLGSQPSDFALLLLKLADRDADKELINLIQLLIEEIGRDSVQFGGRSTRVLNECLRLGLTLPRLHENVRKSIRTATDERRGENGSHSTVEPKSH